MLITNAGLLSGLFHLSSQQLQVISISFPFTDGETDFPFIYSSHMNQGPTMWSYLT